MSQERLQRGNRSAKVKRSQVVWFGKCSTFLPPSISRWSLRHVTILSQGRLQRGYKSAKVKRSQVALVWKMLYLSSAKHIMLDIAPCDSLLPLLYKLSIPFSCKLYQPFLCCGQHFSLDRLALIIFSQHLNTGFAINRANSI